MVTSTSDRGPRTNFRPKSAPPVSVSLTDLAKRILQAAAVRTGLSQSDVIETLLRRHGAAFVAMPNVDEG